MEALILAGGLGTRLASVVSDRAKPVAEVAGRPFVTHLLAQIERCSEIRRAVLCVGHRSDSVQSVLGDRFGRLPIVYSIEPEPLGTGGALRHALESCHPRGPTITMNGDSFLGIALDRLIAFHRASNPMVTLALAHAADGTRFGAAALEGNQIKAFREKGAGGPAWINAGIYVLSLKARKWLLRAPRKFSFEHDALVPWCAESSVLGMKSRARFLDIGTPADYARAALVLPRRSRQ